jgi:predicted phage terminase large subunit-like protein
MTQTTAPQSPKSAAEQLLAKRILARRRLLYFTRITHPSYKPGWVHHDICMRLERFSQAVAEGKSPRLMLLVPPRHGKSELASIRFPAWHLGQHPDHEIINAGYNLDLPMIFSRKVREIAREAEYQKLFPAAQLDPDTGAAEAWKMTKGGGFTAAGVGGGITGKGAHILIIDDPIKNLEEADNSDVRDKLEGWYQSTAYTRLAPGGGVLLIETWWNDDDLAGRLQQAAKRDPNADQFEVIRYPAMAEQFEWRHRDTGHILRTSNPELLPEDIAGAAMRNRILGHGTADQAAQDLEYEPAEFELLRIPGDALHNERYPPEALGRIKATLSPRIWSALYQQNPVPDEGMYFQKGYFRYSRAFPDMRHSRIYTAWDFAIGEKQTNDFTVGATIMQDSTDTLYVLDVHKLKGDSFSIVEAIIDVYQRWGQIPQTDYLLGFEDGQIFKAIEPMLKKRMAERNAYPAYETLKPLTDKLARARPLQGRMQQGRVYFLEDAPWRSAAEQEMLRFPAGAHDDVVDALSWATRLCMGKAPPKGPDEVKTASWRDKLGTLSGTGSHMVA